MNPFKSSNYLCSYTYSAKIKNSREKKRQLRSWEGTLRTTKKRSNWRMEAISIRVLRRVKVFLFRKTITFAFVGNPEPDKQVQRMRCSRFVSAKGSDVINAAGALAGCRGRQSAG